MLELARKLGVAGAVGLLAGLALATWIGPTTDGGFALIVAVCVLAAVAVEGLVVLLRPGKRDD